MKRDRAIDPPSDRQNAPPWCNPAGLVANVPEIVAAHPPKSHAPAMVTEERRTHRLPVFNPWEPPLAPLNRGGMPQALPFRRGTRAFDQDPIASRDDGGILCGHGAVVLTAEPSVGSAHRKGGNGAACSGRRPGGPGQEAHHRQDANPRASTPIPLSRGEAPAECDSDRALALPPNRVDEVFDPYLRACEGGNELRVPIRQAPRRACMSAQVLVTGATSGIGAAIVRVLRETGRSVLAIGRDASKLKSLEDTFPEALQTEAVDLADLGAVDLLGARLRAACPSVSGLVHCAGEIETGLLTAVDAESVARLFAVNVQAPLLLTAHLVDALAAGRGTLLFMNSSAALHAAPGRAAYAATKAALRSYADHARAELNDRGIRVASLFPGRVATPGGAKVFAREGRSHDPERLLQPEDIAALVLQLLDAPGTMEVTDVMLRPRSRSY